MFVQSFGLCILRAPCWPDDQMGQWLCSQGLASPFCSLWGSTHGMETPETGIIEAGSQGRWIASWAETLTHMHSVHTQVRRGTYTASCVAESACAHMPPRVLHFTLCWRIDLSEGKVFYRLTGKLTKENVILFNKLEADLIFYHFRQAVQEGYITEVRFFLPCHVEI